MTHTYTKYFGTCPSLNGMQLLFARFDPGSWREQHTSLSSHCVSGQIVWFTSHALGISMLVTDSASTEIAMPYAVVCRALYNVDVQNIFTEIFPQFVGASMVTLLTM